MPRYQLAAGRHVRLDDGQVFGPSQVVELDQEFGDRMVEHRAAVAVETSTSRKAPAKSGG